ncbi:MAG TPA: hypothetical protein VGI74_04365 [Streptosporangiaceae bacterium]
MDRAGLTAAYLDEVKRAGATPAELTGDMAESAGILLNSFSPGTPYLSRPLFAASPECGQLYTGVEAVRQLLVTLPDRLYDGDFTAFAQDAGAEDYQLQAIAASRSGQVSPQARADLYEDATGFKLMEFNMGSALGGMENADLCRAMLRHPLLASFAAGHGLGYVDTMRAQVAGLLAGTGFAPGSSPVVAVADWPGSYASRLGPYMHKLAARWREFGLDAHGCHMGELEYRSGRVWLGGRAVDVVSRMWLLEYLLEPGAAELLDPLLGAVARGEVAMFTPLDTELFGSKASLAMLSDERNRHLFTRQELASIDAILPWTRAVRPGPVTLEDGGTASLFDYAIGHASELVLKPTLRYGGQEVLPGWHPDTTPELWRDQLTKAMGGPYVIQRRIHPVPELFPAGGGELASWIVAWGVYTTSSGFGGIITRAGLVSSALAVLNVSAGAHLGCCLTPGSPR